MAANGILLALLARPRLGHGQRVEIAMLDVVTALLVYQGQLYLSTGRVPTRTGNRHNSIVPYEVFRAADAYLTIGVANNAIWRRFCAALERPELVRDPRYDTEAKRVANRGPLLELLEALFLERSAAEWLTRMAEAGVPAGRIKTVGEALSSEQLRARGMVVTLTHPTAGAVPVVGPPILLEETPGAVGAPPPLLGEHTREILTQVLDYPPAEITELARRGTI